MPQRANYQKRAFIQLFSVPGAFKLYHLQPIEPLLFPNFCIFFTFILGGQFLLPLRANYQKKGIRPTPKLNGTEGFRCLGHTNWTILITPEGQLSEKGIHPTPKLDGTEGFRCLGHSNWTIFSPLSYFCFQIFASISPSYWEANSYYPRGLIIRKGHSSNSKTG